jgi:SpoVK/Ycf46/Vps4 family AAA+-type ATPase
MKKNIFQAAILMAVGFSLSSSRLQNTLTQELTRLSPIEYNTVENCLSASIKREAETRIPGQHNVIILSGNSSISKQNTARWLAQKINVPIYRIDLSQVVAEYFEETQKNLNLIFEMAKNKNWVLFFDEGDALFGRRTPVKDAHDKYDNETTNYFASQVEKYRASIIISVTASNNINPFIFEKYVRFSIH